MSAKVVRSLSGLELSKILPELKALEGGRLDKFSQFDPDSFQMAFFLSSKGKRFLNIRLPSLVYVSESKVSVDEKYGHFGKILDNMFSGARLASLGQLGIDRVLCLDFTYGDSRRSLILELFSKGNLIALKDNTISAVLREEKWSKRELKPGLAYVPPPSAELTGFVQDRDLGSHLLGQGSASIGKALAVVLGLGKTFSDEVLSRASIPPDTGVSALGKSQIEGIQSALISLLGEGLSPTAYFKEESLVELSPVPLLSFGGFAARKYASFSQLLEKHSNDPIYSKNPKSGDRRKRWTTIITEQEAYLEEIEKDADLSRRQGELIYLNYAQIVEVLSELKRLRKDHSWDQIKALWAAHPFIKNIDDKNGKITVEFV